MGHYSNSRQLGGEGYDEIAAAAGTATHRKSNVTPKRRANAELMAREFLTDAEVARVSEAAKGNRYGHRDATMILVAYRHGSPFVFTSERWRPSPRWALHGWSSALGWRPGIGFKVHPHMLRHASGFALANKGNDTRGLQAYLGYRNIQRTVRYTELAPDRFKGFWR
jgi:hypothetical protein